MAPKRGNPALRRGIGQRIRALREEAGRTQESVAWECGVAKALLSRIESGENLPSLPRLVAIARQLGVHAADIVAFDMRDARCRLLDAIRRRDGESAAAALEELGFELAKDQKARRLLRVAEPVKRPSRPKRPSRT